MKVSYLTQPDCQLGSIVQELISGGSPPRLVVWVSAFAQRQTLLRHRNLIKELKAQGTRVRMVVGVDLGGTSEEALKEILGWGIEAYVVRHGSGGGHTFHPKIWWIERPSGVDLLLGSANATDGGLYTNYEAAIHLSFRGPKDAAELAKAKEGLSRFLSPGGPTCLPLTDKLVSVMVQRGDVPTEEQQRAARGRATKSRKTSVPPSPFGTESIAGPPRLDPSLVDGLLKQTRKALRASSKSGKAGGAMPLVPDEAQLSPWAFFMVLNKMKSDAKSKRGSKRATKQKTTIPGEARIPIMARNIAQSFWGWPLNYKKATEKKPKKVQEGAEPGGTDEYVERVYWNWRPQWLVGDASEVDAPVNETVRMYFVASNSDFRFYSPRLVDLGAKAGDIVRIRRVDSGTAQFECLLAKKGTPQYKEWLRHCDRKVGKGGRKYGYL